MNDLSSLCSDLVRVDIIAWQKPEVKTEATDGEPEPEKPRPKLLRNFKFPTEDLSGTGLTKYATKMIEESREEWPVACSIDDDWLRKIFEFQTLIGIESTDWHRAYRLCDKDWISFQNLIRRAGERGYLKNYSSLERGPTHIPFDYILMKNFRSYG